MCHFVNRIYLRIYLQFKIFKRNLLEQENYLRFSYIPTLFQYLSFYRTNYEIVRSLIAANSWQFKCHFDGSCWQFVANYHISIGLTSSENIFWTLQRKPKENHIKTKIKRISRMHILWSTYLSVLDKLFCGRKYST